MIEESKVNLSGATVEEMVEEIGRRVPNVLIVIDRDPATVEKGEVWRGVFFNSLVSGLGCLNYAKVHLRNACRRNGR